MYLTSVEKLEVYEYKSCNIFAGLPTPDQHYLSRL